MTHAIGALPFCRRALFFFLQVVATGSVSLAMVSVSEGELYRHLIAMLSASEPSTMDDVYGRMCQNKFGKQNLILKIYKRRAHLCKRIVIAAQF